MTTPNPSELFTPFLPSTFVVPEEEDRRRTFLSDKLSMISDVVNDKKIGSYTQAAESQNGEKWSYKTTSKVRNGVQAIAYIPSFPNTGVLTLTLTSTPQFPIQGIDPNFVVTLVYGSASKPCSAVGAGDGNYFSFMAQGDARVSFVMSDNQLVITTTIDMTAYSGFIVVQYLRDGV